MKTITRDNATIHYNITGSGEMALLFATGSYINQTYWNEQVAYFSRQYRVVTFDWPGQGLSDGSARTDWSLQGYAEDLAALITELQSKNVILIAHSIGAEISLMAVTARPLNITGFVAVDFFKNAATPLPPEYASQTATILANLQKDFANTNEQYARTALLTPQTPAAVTDRVVQDYRNAYPPMGRAVTPEVFEAYKTQQALLPQLNLKLYLLNVDYQPTVEEPLKKFAGSGYELVHMEGTSHYPMIENGARFNSLLEGIIKKIEGEGRTSA